MTGPAQALIGTPTTYLVVSAVLMVVLMLELWREMATSGSGGYAWRMGASLAYAISRIVLVVFAPAVVTRSMLPPLGYLLFNLAATLLVMREIPDALDRATTALWLAEHPDAEPEEAAAPARTRRRAQWRTLALETALWGLGGVLLYVVLPIENGGFDVLASLVVITATLRASVALVATAREAPSALRLPTSVMAVAGAVSWSAVLAASATAGGVSAWILRGAWATDVIMLLAGVVALHNAFIIAGIYHRELARWKHRQAERARAEVELLERVASDMHEDSSSVIRRQQDRYRAMAARIEGLEKILDFGLQIQTQQDVGELLQKVVDLVSGEFGFERVILRLLNERTRSFETRAFTGVSPDAEAALRNHRLPLSEFEGMCDPRCRVGNSYFIRRRDDAPSPDAGGDEIVVTDEWREIDRVIVPLVDEGRRRTIGYISVEDPRGAGYSLVEAVDRLQAIASLVVGAIRNATYYREVREKNRKLRQYTEKLSGLNRLKSNFVATVSHEFRTPLTSIRAYCETLLKNVDQVDRGILREFLTVIDEESDRLMKLIEDILDFSRMESGAMRFERTPCNVSETIDTAVAELSRHFERKSITLHRVRPERPVLLRAESELVSQMMVNLLHNAAKFTPEGGNVWVRVEDESVSVRIVVEDDGPGIPPDQVDEIFERFHQADASSTREHGGTGIGLAIVKNVVDWHDGKVWVESTPGRGARFVVVLPKKQVIVRSQVLGLEGTVRRVEVERYLEAMVETVAEMMNVKRVSLMLREPEDDALRIACAIGLDEEIVETTQVAPGEGIAGRVFEEGRSYLVRDINRDPRVAMQNNAWVYDSRSFLSVPVRSGPAIVGVINVADPVARECFDGADCRLLEFFADRIGVALARLETYVDRARAFEAVREVFRGVLDANRYVDNVNTDAVSLVLDDVADALRLSQHEQSVLRYAWTIYDLGLSRTGYNVIKKPGGITPRDRDAIRMHPAAGTDMLEAIDETADVRDAVLYHHENYDGSGYPAGLAGDDIPVLARILRVADTFRALISHRPYQRQYTVAEAVDVIEGQSGTAFDPGVVRAFTAAVARHVDRFRSVRAPQTVERQPADTPAGS